MRAKNRGVFMDVFHFGFAMRGFMSIVGDLLLSIHYYVTITPSSMGGIVRRKNKRSNRHARRPLKRSTDSISIVVMIAVAAGGCPTRAFDRRRFRHRQAHCQLCLLLGSLSNRLLESVGGTENV